MRATQKGRAQKFEMGFQKAHETKHDEMQGGAEGLTGKLPRCRVTSNRMAQQPLRR